MNINHNSNEFVWTEKYRPTVIEDCILPVKLREIFNKVIEVGQMQNMIFASGPGTGKTSTARALANQLNCDFMVINASEENGIDLLRNKIRQYASTVSMTGGLKVILLDEADRLTGQTQDALKAFMEEFSANCRFILTCNTKHKLIEPLHSRCTVVDFTASKTDIASLSAQFMKRMKKILLNEKIVVNDKALAEIIMKYAPDWRRVLNECQKLSSGNGEINAGSVASLSNDNVMELVEHLKNKDFKAFRSWVVNNAESDPTVLIRRLYEILADVAEPASVPQGVLILADYSYKNVFVADKELNLVAMLVEIAGSISFK